jgi:predicted RNase H-like HicB family nuclease
VVLDVIVTKTNDGFTAEIPSLNGCETWAHEEDTVLSKILELAAFYLKTDVKKLKLDKARKIKDHSVYKLVFYKSG